ncbi:MAG: glycosyltransferase family 2 protein, partial [Gemmatimonadota bacterium]|nr:glycosyltransferase family 2 protein [Gemmatimonadota bacterium]
QWGTEAFGWLLRALMGLGEFGDTQCGFKFFQAAVVRDLCARQQIAGFMFDVELLLLARQSDYRIAKIPVKWRFDPDSRFNPVTGTLANLKDLARIRWVHRRRQRIRR